MHSHSKVMNAAVSLENTTEAKKELSSASQRARLEIGEAGRLIHDTGSLSIGRTFVGAVRAGDGSELVASGFPLRSTSTPPSAALYTVASAQLREGNPDSIIRAIAPVIAGLLNARPEIQSVIYTQSPNLTAFAVARRPLPVVYGFGLLRRTPHDLPVTRGQRQLDSAAVLEALLRNPRSPAVLLANRGVLVFGRDTPIALAKVVVSLEESAGIIINAVALGGVQPFPPGAHEAVQPGGVFE